jgi:Toprim domain
MLQTRINNSSGCCTWGCSRAVHGALQVCLPSSIPPRHHSSSATAQLFSQAGRAPICQASTLVVVESPTKAKKIADFLGSGYVVTASMGHVRQLPSKPGAVHPDDSFKMEWQISKHDVVKEIASMASKADRVLLAPDPDREGEAIAWHLSELLQVHFLQMNISSLFCKAAAPMRSDMLC